MTTLETPTAPDGRHEPVAPQPQAPAPAADGPDRRSSEGRTAGIRMLVVVVGGLLVAQRYGALKTVFVVAAVFLMIMLHELGHYTVAKRTGMKVTEFFIGFGPRLWSFRRGETEYGIKALPLGGYVKVPGMTNLEEVAPEDEARTYRQQGTFARIAMAMAGSTVHMILAFGLLLTLNGVVGNPAHVETTTEIETISRLEGQPSPAEQAGIRPGDRIVSVDGTPVTSWDGFRALVKDRPGSPLALVVERREAGATVSVPLTATPVDRGGVGFLGLASKTVDPTVGPLQAVGRSANDFATLFTGTFKAIGGIFSPTGVKGIADNVSGKTETPDAQGSRFLSPVGLVHVAGASADEGIASVLQLLVLLNVFVGLFNLLPLLPFDGGHVVIAAYEGIRSRISGRRHYADAAKLLPVAYATVLLLVFIGLSSLWVDIRNPIKL